MSFQDIIQTQLTAKQREKLGLLLGESPEKSQKLIHIALMTLTSALAKLDFPTLSRIGSQNTEFMSLDTLDLNNPTQITDFFREGTNVLHTLLGDRTDDVIEKVATEAAVPNHSAASLMKALAPLVIRTFASEIRKIEEKEKTFVAVPLSASVTTRFPWAWWVLPLLTVAALYVFRGCFTSKKIEDGAQVSAIPNAVPLDSVITTVEKVLPSGVALQFPDASIENELIQFIEDKNRVVDKNTWFNFRKLQFKTGSTELDDVTFQEVRNMAEILRAYPAVKIKVGGYTDAVGKEMSNLQLSAGRAEQVVQSLIGLGIDPSRLSSEGYGSQHPVATNDTAEGRAQNRRIAVRVTEK